MSMSLAWYGRTHTSVERLDVNSGSPGVARNILRRAASAYRIPATKVDVAALLVSELVTIAVNHVSGDDSATLAISLEEDSIRASVWSPGLWFEEATARRREDGGWGLMLVDELAPAWGARYVDSGVDVWVEV